jgi:lysophospholipase L1-like esterase
MLAALALALAAPVRIGMIGDSITQGYGSSGGIHPYPEQLQILLDRTKGPGKYTVSNLGQSGTCLENEGDFPFSKGDAYKRLVSEKWDILTVMMGTNDAKDPASGGPGNWQHDCGDEDPSFRPRLEPCRFAKAYADFARLLRTLGTTPAGPKIFAMIPPPLYLQGAYGMNQTVINSVLPGVLPLVAAQNGFLGPIDLYHSLGGSPDWRTRLPHGGCAKNSTYPSCRLFCDAQGCDQAHPNDAGYEFVASVVYKALDLGQSETVIV